MTLVMYDSIYPSTLPAGADAYLGYTDGHWPTCTQIRAQFPASRVICLTVTGATLNADGCDIETGDLGPVAGAQWLQRKLATKPQLPPVAYCSVTSMADVVSELANYGVPRSSVLLLSAHYGWKNAADFADPVNAHICGPSSCTLIDLPQDGTQWTDAAAGVGGQIDASQLNDQFFTTQKGNDMPLLIQGTGPGVYLLDGGKMHGIQDQASENQYLAAGVPKSVVSALEMTTLLADFPPGQPVVTVTVPDVSVVFPVYTSTPSPA